MICDGRHQAPHEEGIPVSLVQALVFLHEQYKHVDQQAFKGEDTQA